MIKASYEVVQPITGQSFLFRKFDNSAFDAPYHFHPEYELTYILDGSGKRYVGSHMEDFGPGDLVLLGPNLPHCWKLVNDQLHALSKEKSNFRLLIGLLEVLQKLASTNDYFLLDQNMMIAERSVA